MAQERQQSRIARYVHKARKYLFRNLKPDKLRKIIDKKEQERLNAGLHVAAATGKTKRVERLLKLGADLEARESEYGMTPLIHAANNGHGETCALLLEKGANANAKDTTMHGRTAVDAAKWNGRVPFTNPLTNTYYKEYKETIAIIEFAPYLKPLMDKDAFVPFLSGFIECVGMR